MKDKAIRLVDIADGMVLGRQRCYSCGESEWVAWVSNVRGGFIDFTCRNCGGTDSQLDGPAFYTIKLSYGHAKFICEDAIAASVTEAANAIRNRES